MRVLAPSRFRTAGFDRRGLSLLATLASSLALSFPGHAQDKAPRLELGRPWLENLSTARQAFRLEESATVDKRVRGVFPIGDGHVFAYQGLGRRANHLQGLSGPRYQTAAVHAPQGHFGELVLDLVAGSEVVALPEQRVWRARGVNAVFGEDASDDGVSLQTLTFASFTTDTLWRIVEVHNGSNAPRQLAVRATWTHAQRGDGSTLSSVDPGKGFEAQLVSSRAATASDKNLDIDVGTLAPGAKARFVLALRTKLGGADFAAKTIDEENALAALDAMHVFWQRRLSNTATLTIEDERLTDLVEDWKVLMLVQRCAESGGVAPMVSYRGTWIRDNTGPMLAFLRYGLFTEAKQLLDYVYRATLVTGTLQNHFPLDLDVSKAAEIEKTIRWDTLRIPPTELASWIILQHEWYYRATWDIDFLEARWPFLKACYNALKAGADASFPTHGDETYLHGAFFSLWPDRVGQDAALPADAPGRRARSFDNSMLYLITINAMGELVEDLDKRRAGNAGEKEGWSSTNKAAFDRYHVDYLLKMESVFWDPEHQRFAPFVSPITGAMHPAPYAPVNLRPQWIGYTYAIGEKNRENLRHTLDELWQKDGRIGMTPTTGYVTGSVQGLLLYSLADLEDARRDDALQALVRMAGPAGEWGELYDPEGHPIAGYDAEYPNRLRPWESGINIDAIFFALNGIRYVTCPGWSKKDARIKLRLPGQASWWALRGAEHDAHRFDIFVDRVFEPVYPQDPKKAANATGVPESRMRFRVEYDAINKRAAGLDWIDAAVNVGATLYMRLPTLDAPIYEVAEWPADSEAFFPKRDGPGNWKFERPVVASANTLILTSRMDGPSNGSRLDVGTPMDVAAFRGLLLDGDKPRFDRVLVDVGANAPSRATMKSAAFWSEVRPVIDDYVAKGGSWTETPFLDSWHVLAPLRGTGVEALRADLPGVQATTFEGTIETGDGTASWRDVRAQRLAIGDDSLQKDQRVVLAVTEFAVNGDLEAILKVGCSAPFSTFLDGKKIEVGSTDRGSDRADRFEGLVRLGNGRHRLAFALLAGDAEAVLRARFARIDGTPLELK
ncbi:MAG: hypothetical protein H6833_02720 [Planctomycetes bacterium]|nr:hypothetical protein [Planctomycetota bacterium]